MKENKSTILEFVKYYIIYRIFKSIFGKNEVSQRKSVFEINFVMILILLVTYYIFLK